MARYAIWDKKTPIITPIYEVLTPEQWIERYPAAGIDSVTVICAAGEVNGAIFDTLGAMVMRYEAMGCVFTDDMTDQEKLEAAEAFEDEMAAKAAEAAAAEQGVAERQTAALEAIADGQTTENAAAMNALLTGEE